METEFAHPRLPAPPSPPDPMIHDPASSVIRRFFHATLVGTLALPSLSSAQNCTPLVGKVGGTSNITALASATPGNYQLATIRINKVIDIVDWVPGDPFSETDGFPLSADNPTDICAVGTVNAFVYDGPDSRRVLIRDYESTKGVIDVPGATVVDLDIGGGGGWIAIGDSTFTGETGRVVVHPIASDGDPVGTGQLVTPVGGLPGDRFGTAVAIDVGPDRTTLVVGAPGTNNGGSEEGAVYVYVLDEGTGLFELDASWWPAHPGGDFGRAVDVDGDHVIVGAPLTDDGTVNGGATTFLLWNGATYDWWGSFAANQSGALLGHDVAVDNGIAVAGRPRSNQGSNVDVGGISIYRFDGADWIVEQELLQVAGLAPEDKFGTGVDMIDSHVAVQRAPSSDVHVIDLSGAPNYEVAMWVPRYATVPNPLVLDIQDDYPPVVGLEASFSTDNLIFQTGVLLISLGPGEFPLGPGQTLLLDPLQLLPPIAGTSTIRVTVPYTCNLVGMPIYAQTVYEDLGDGPRWSNALDIVIGNL